MLRNFFANRPELKSPREISLMREAGKLVSSAL
ncbi:type I methionyl aminopeptidase, partial [bacterium]|nr:type I methionyl aminopeptidase [bacterium]